MFEMNEETVMNQPGQTAPSASAPMTPSVRSVPLVPSVPSVASLSQDGAPEHPAEHTPDDLLRLDQQVCFALAVAARNVIGLYRPVLEPLGLTHPQYLVMLALWERAPHVTLTPAGRDLREQALDVPPQVIARLGMEVSQLQELHRSLTTVIAAARAAQD